MSAASSKIVVRHLYKIFGQHGQAQRAQKLLEKGYDKSRLNRETGAVVGVNDVSFDVKEGEIFVLMGLSGSGKSTLIRLVNRLITPTAGEVLIGGEDVLKMGQRELTALRRREMSMVFQSFALMPNRNVLGNAAFGLEVAGMGRAKRESMATEVLEQVGLGDFKHSRIDELSGGMRQRVGLARALAVNPSLIIMDEAFSALDPLIRREMQDILLELQQQHRRTVLFVSHDIEEAMRIGNRIAIMEGGSMVQVGTPQEIIASPANDYVRNFFATIDTSRFLSAASLAMEDVPVYALGHALPGLAELKSSLGDHQEPYAIVVNEKRYPVGLVEPERLATEAIDAVSRDHLSPIMTVDADVSLDNVMKAFTDTSAPLAVVDEEGCFQGAITQQALFARLREVR